MLGKLKRLFSLPRGRTGGEKGTCLSGAPELNMELAVSVKELLDYAAKDDYD